MNEPNNPFSYSPDDPSHAQFGQPQISNANQSVPVGIMIVAILCIIMGCLGLIGSCLQFIGPFFLQLATVSEEAIQRMPPAQQEEQRYFNEQMSANIYLGVVTGVINLFVAGGLIAGALGTIMKQQWGIPTFRIAVAAAALFVVVRFIVTIGFSINQNFVQADKIPDHMRAAQQMGFWFGLALSGIFMIVLLALYITSYILLSKQKPQATMGV